jgi:polynucleotide 5'-kinase involved in rRNA processing
LGQTLKKKEIFLREGDEKGLLVALQDANENFLGIGILEKINYKRRIIRIFTSVHENVTSLHLGQIKLDKKGREIGIPRRLCKLC